MSNLNKVVIIEANNASELESEINKYIGLGYVISSDIVLVNEGRFGKYFLQRMELKNENSGI